MRAVKALDFLDVNYITKVIMHIYSGFKIIYIIWSTTEKQHKIIEHWMP